LREEGRVRGKRAKWNSSRITPFPTNDLEKEEAAMATYVTLIKFTEKGVKDIKDTCKRAAEFKSHAKKHGIEVKEQYWCMGAYDGLIIFDAPDDETATGAVLSLSSRDNVATQTLRAFNAAEMGKILTKIQ
jgi:uncharacterized protein with GYD domain